MRSRPAALLTGAALALAVLFLPRPAAAFERQWHTGAGVGYALLADGGSYPGLGGNFHLTYGLTDAFNAYADINLASHPGGDLMFLGASAGATYVIDILQWIPYAGLTLGAYDVVQLGPCGTPGQQTCHTAKFGVSVPFGLDYSFTRSFAAGISGKYTLLIPGAEDGPGSYFTTFAHAEILWGY